MYQCCNDDDADTKPNDYNPDRSSSHNVDANSDCHDSTRNGNRQHSINGQ